MIIKEHKLYGRAKYHVDYGERLKNETVGALELKSKSGKDRAKLRFRVTIPSNPSFEPSRTTPGKPTESNLADRSQSNSSVSLNHPSPAVEAKSPKQGAGSAFKPGLQTVLKDTHLI